MNNNARRSEQMDVPQPDSDAELRELRSGIDTRLHRNARLTPEHRKIVVDQIMQLIKSHQPQQDLEQVKLEARIEERKSIDADIQRKTYSEATSWRSEYLRIAKRNANRIAELTTQLAKLKGEK